MDATILLRKMELPTSGRLMEKTKEIQRRCNLKFGGSFLGLGEVCKAVLCVDLAATLLKVPFNREKAVKISGANAKTYGKGISALQNALDIRPRVNLKELAVQFGCIRIVESVERALLTYKQRFVAALPAGRRDTADFGRPVFPAAAFFLTAKKQKLKIDKAKLLQAASISDQSEFSNVCASMLELCFDVLGIAKAKPDAKNLKSNRGLIDHMSLKRQREEEDESEEDEEEDGACDADCEGDRLEVPGVKKSKRAQHKSSYEAWRSSVLTAKEHVRAIVGDQPSKKLKQASLFGAFSGK